MTRRPSAALARAVLGLALPLALLSGCGGDDQPAELEPMVPAVPADLCALVPKEQRAGLETSGNSDDTGNPTASCGLTSAVGATPKVRGVLTTLQLNDEDEADRVYQSQCRAIDPQAYAVRSGFAVDGAEQACGGSAKEGDGATVAAVRGRDVLTARMTSAPAGRPDTLARSAALLEAVLAELPDTTPSS